MAFTWGWGGSQVSVLALWLGTIWICLAAKNIRVNKAPPLGFASGLSPRRGEEPEAEGR
jgi:hypothetical protein